MQPLALTVAFMEPPHPSMAVGSGADRLAVGSMVVEAASTVAVVEGFTAVVEVDSTAVAAEAVVTLVAVAEGAITNQNSEWEIEKPASQSPAFRV